MHVRVPATYRARQTRPSTLVIGVGALAVIAYVLLPGTAAKDLGYSTIGAAASTVMFVAARRNRRSERAGWYLLAASSWLFVLGDGVYDVYDIVLHRDAPFPSTADALYLAGYPLLFAGVARVTRLRIAPGAREARADAAIVAMGALALSWHLLMGSYAHDSTMTLFGRAVALAYPIMDIAVLFIVVKAMMTRSTRRACDNLLAIANLLMLVADFAYDLLVLHSAYAQGNPVDLLFLANYVVLAAAAVDPSARTAPAEVTRTADRRSWLVVVSVAAALPSALVLVCHVANVPVDTTMQAAVSVVLCGLAALRGTWMFRRLRRQSAALAERSSSLQTALEVQRALEADLRHQAFHDSLTGLPNRALFHDRVEHALATCRRQSTGVAVLFCDLDGFKDVNDARGHQIGDAVLVAASGRIAGVLRDGDTVARLGGDEFGVLLEGVTDIEPVTRLAERICTALRESMHVQDEQIRVSTSIGVALCRGVATTEELLAEADAAMYEAKAAGKNRVALFEPSMRSRILDRRALVDAFPTALRNGEFYLEYQPQIRVSDGALEGFEALVRWQHPELGRIEPGRFIALAEETGFIVPLGRWILEQACREAASWQGSAAPTVSVNLSACQLRDSTLLEDVRSALAASGLPAHRLVLEVTESVLMSDPAATRLALDAMRADGARVAIDDFGTGYSSLSYLRQLPLDIIKIDKSFIDPLGNGSDEAHALVQTIARLAVDLGLETTAEGIENADQLEVLRRVHCTSAQGYHISRPLSAAAARPYLAASKAVVNTIDVGRRTRTTEPLPERRPGGVRAEGPLASSA